ncbi:MAG: hypothetical protein Q9169_007012, partial [Polycauliona sp. 2 TL-2023]
MYISSITIGIAVFLPVIAALPLKRGINPNSDPIIIPHVPLAAHYPPTTNTPPLVAANQKREIARHGPFTVITISPTATDAPNPTLPNVPTHTHGILSPGLGVPTRGEHDHPPAAAFNKKRNDDGTHSPQSEGDPGKIMDPKNSHFPAPKMSVPNHRPDVIESLPPRNVNDEQRDDLNYIGVPEHGPVPEGGPDPSTWHGIGPVVLPPSNTQERELPQHGKVEPPNADIHSHDDGLTGGGKNKRDENINNDKRQVILPPFKYRDHAVKGKG